MTIETHRFTWNSIEIELTYQPNKYNVIAHLEVESVNPPRAPLPITETGYLSHHHPMGTVEQGQGTLVEQVTCWLNEKARSRHWQDFVEKSRQGNLFDLI